MVDLAKQVIDYYTKYQKEPKIEDLEIKESILKERIGKVFVTIYLNWEINWSSWNINEIEKTLAEEIIQNTINAISKDPRFKPISIDDAKNVKIRIDEISSRTPLQEGAIKTLEPTKTWVIAIKKDYETLAVVLPNISPKLLTWDDFYEALKFKLWIKQFEEKDYILYSIETVVDKNF